MLTKGWLRRYNRDGSVAWDKTFQFASDVPLYGIAWFGSDLLLGGYAPFAPPDPTLGLRLIRVKGDGSPVWNKAVGGGKNEVMASLAVRKIPGKGDDIVVTAWRLASSPGGWEPSLGMRVYALDGEGVTTAAWQADGKFSPGGLVTLPDGGVLFATVAADYKGFELVRLDAGLAQATWQPIAYGGNPWAKSVAGVEVRADGSVLLFANTAQVN